MKTKNLTGCLMPLAAALLVVSCTSTKRNATADVRDAGNTTAPAAKAGDTPAGPAADDNFDEYATTEVSDPLERINRATFWCNDKIYLIVLRPVSKGYEKVLPERVRKGIDHAFENARFPIRFVNCTLQGKFKRAGKETEKLLINTVLGLGGLIRQSDKIPSLADVPAEDTGQTFATWGIGHGAYIVLPFFGPTSVRDGVGLAGDYALNPVNWGSFWHGDHDWTLAVQGTNTIRSLPEQMSIYDLATEDAIDPYLSVRSAYIQNRAEARRR